MNIVNQTRKENTLFMQSHVPQIQGQWQKREAFLDTGVEPETIRLGWLAGLGCNLGQPEFRLEVDGVGALTFRSVADSTWRATGEGGLVVSNDDALARRMYLYINKAWGYGDPKPDRRMERSTA